MREPEIKKLMISVLASRGGKQSPKPMCGKGCYSPSTEVE